MTLAPFSRQYRGGGQRAISPYRMGPLADITDVNDRFGQLIRSFFGDTSMGGGMGGGMGSWSTMAVPVDVEETDDSYVVEVDLPNVNPDEVDVEMRGEELRISGRFQERERTGVVRRQNRPAGDFEYVVDLPSDIDPNRVEATYDGGVLTITVGKAQDAQPRRIEVREVQRQMGQGDGQRDRQREGQRDGQQAMAGDGEQARQGKQQRA
jgi:HSP20 family protein